MCTGMGNLHYDRFLGRGLTYVTCQKPIPVEYSWFDEHEASVMLLRMPMLDPFSQKVSLEMSNHL